MVASRKPRAVKAPPARRKRETLEEKFERVMAEPVGSPFPKLTKREARYFLRRLSGSNPDAMPGNEVVKRFYGLWPEPQTPEDYPD